MLVDQCERGEAADIDHLQIIIYDLDVTRPLTAMTLILCVGNLLRSLSFVLLPVRRYVAMIYYGLTTVME